MNIHLGKEHIRVSGADALDDRAMVRTVIDDLLGTQGQELHPVVGALAGDVAFDKGLPVLSTAVVDDFVVAGLAPAIISDGLSTAWGGRACPCPFDRAAARAAPTFKHYRSV